MKHRLISSTEDRVLLLFLGFLFLLSVAVPIWESITDERVPLAWHTPVILAALYAILRLVGSVPEIRTDVRYLREVADVRVERLPNVTDFYEGLNEAVRTATSSLDLTHIRDTPPADFGEQASQFFSQLLEWAETEGRSIRRIICVRSPSMYEWAVQLSEQTKHRSRFNVRVIDWTLDAPFMNLAIVDNKVTYLALTGSTPERTRGLGIEDETTSQYFSDYYENLWRNTTDLDVWLSTHSFEGTASSSSPST